MQFTDLPSPPLDPGIVPDGVHTERRLDHQPVLPIDLANSDIGNVGELRAVPEASVEHECASEHLSKKHIQTR